jgi:hypothetical protein
MKTTFLTVKTNDDYPNDIKSISLNGFWKEESLKNYCEKRNWTPSNWSHSYVTCEGVREVSQGNFISKTNISSFRDHAAEMGL